MPAVQNGYEIAAYLLHKGLPFRYLAPFDKIVKSLCRRHPRRLADPVIIDLPVTNAPPINVASSHHQSFLPFSGFVPQIARAAAGCMSATTAPVDVSVISTAQPATRKVVICFTV